jgi:hypothetical protein
MDIGALASSLTTVLVPLLPYLLKAGEKAAEETGKTVAGQSWEWAKSVWTKLRPKVEAKEAALEAAQDVAEAPGDEDLQASFRVQLKKLLTEDQSLAEEVSRWLDQGRAAGINVSAIHQNANENYLFASRAGVPKPSSSDNPVRGLIATQAFTVTARESASS